MSDEQGSETGGGKPRTAHATEWAAFHRMAETRGEGMHPTLLQAIERDVLAARKLQIERLSALSAQIQSLEQQPVERQPAEHQVAGELGSGELGSGELGEAANIIAFPKRPHDPQRARAAALRNADVIQVDFKASAKARRKA